MLILKYNSIIYWYTGYNMKLLLFILYYRSALHKLFSLSYLWYSTLGLIIAVGVGLLVTAVTGECWGVGGGRGV